MRHVFARGELAQGSGARARSLSRYELPAAIAVATGTRRGEILALRWSDLDDGATLARVQRSLQPTHGLVFEEPKTRRSRRSVVLPTS